MEMCIIEKSKKIHREKNFKLIFSGTIKKKVSNDTFND